MANIANTAFKLNVNANAVEPEIAVPDTGAYTKPVVDQFGTDNSAAIIVLAIFIVLAIIVNFICKKLQKHSTSFKLHHKKISLIRLCSILTFFISLGLLGKILVVDQNSTFASSTTVNVEIASTSEVVIRNEQ